MNYAAKFLALVPMACALVAHAGDWPQFRGPTGLGYTEEKGLPLKWDGKTGEGIRWKVPLPKSDSPFSSPIVVGDRVVVTCVQNEPVTHRVLCFAKVDGELMWETTVPPGPWILKDLRGGYGAPTPCSDGRRIYVVFGSAVVAALDLEGKMVWRKELANYAFDVALGTSPVLFKDTVILDCDQTGKTSSIVAFDQATGDIRWEVKRPDMGFAHSTPVVVQVGGRAQMLVSASKALQGIDPTNGQMLWWCSASGDAASPAYDGKVVYSDSGRGGKGVCVDPTGNGDVSQTHVRWTYPQIPEGLSSPIIAQGLVWRSHSPEIVKAFRVSDGTLAFSERLKGVSTYASPIATTDGRIYFASAGRSYVVKANESGDKLEILAENDLGEENRATAAVSDGQIYMRSGKNLYCIGTP
jgi:outer membrane protein assembly factor BamB